ncbi:hypothetical protein AALM99_07785 [Lactococcus muris]|uniref:Uncharacterized protein n=2 Tax=Lactococcus TaxID=1357 RepID=A0ABV4D9A2_9LACT|nr:hypothetical protein [Lactococcus garvieae]
MCKKHGKVLAHASAEEVNMFVVGKNIDEIVPIIRQNTSGGRSTGDFIYGYIVYWFEDI